MNPVIFLPFIFVVGAYCAEMDAGRGVNLCVVMGSFSLHDDCSRVYQYHGAQGVHRIKVIYHKESPSGGECVVRDIEAQRELSFLMEFGRDAQNALHTTVAYSDRKKDGKMIVSSWAPSCKKNEGCIKLSAPFWALKGRDSPMQWSTPIAFDTLSAEPTIGCRPANYGIITAGLNGASVTQYVFRTSNIHEGVFVNMRCAYDKLDTVEFSWGTEAYGGQEVCADKANTQRSDALIVTF